MKSEWLSLFRQWKSPDIIFSVFLGITIAAINKFRRKLTDSTVVFYPKYIKVISDDIPLSNLEIKYACCDVPEQHQMEKSMRLKLAVGHLNYKQMPDWNHDFSDSEQFVSLHRWNWLLWAMTDESQTSDFAWGVKLMRSWLISQTPLPKGLASESYTVGERISNAVLFSRLQQGRWDALPEDISLALNQMASHLAKNIEYYPAGMSGNHVINNARALIFAGFSLNHMGFIKLGTALIEERLPALIYDNGVFREGSSHYHFLFLRWLLEIWFVADEMNDQNIINLVSPYLAPMLEFCHFLLVSDQKGDYTLPTIGDISPDCDPQWIKDLPWSSLAVEFYSSNKSLGERHKGGVNYSRTLCRRQMPHTLQGLI